MSGRSARSATPRLDALRAAATDGDQGLKDVLAEIDGIMSRAAAVNTAARARLKMAEERLAEARRLRKWAAILWVSAELILVVQFIIWMAK